ncbi:hypothetical protein DQ384_38510 [Sphaerisporangium album]|uniref:Uncharacterized protein n=1 Tax=Sphaerisporangium album TaxID=509200 RepID=A0A367ELP4_9ACTN|nr:hypothetical protein [Sphaerisporangium album]RCG19028.1 hypothetical protein DQ384_38510 [Sphaerisporangium album]
MTWQVEIIITPRHLDDQQLGQLAEALVGAAFTYDQDTGTVSVRVAVNAKTQAEAVRAASARFAEVARTTLGEVVPYVGIRVARGDNDPAPRGPELVGYTEIAALLGHMKGKPLSRQRARELAEEHDDFPAPVARLSMGPVFTLASVLEFGRNWEARTGRPRIGR